MDPLKLLYIIHNPPPQKKKTDRYLIKINRISSNPCISGCDSGVSGHEISGTHGLFFEHFPYILLGLPWMVLEEHL